MPQPLKKSQVVTHPAKKARLPKKAHNSAADLTKPRTVVKFGASRGPAARSQMRLASADADEVFATLAKVFSKM
jgi:hypothetical protein